MKYYRFLGQEGRTTIPLEIREYLDMEDHDLLSFCVEDDAVIIRREQVCNDCARAEEEPFDEFFDSLPLAQQQALVAHLAKKILQKKGEAYRGKR